MGSKFSLPEEQTKELAAITNFKKEDLRRWYKKFMRDFPDGKLGKEKFREIFGKTYECEYLSEYIFGKFDRNHDGHVSFKELMLTLSVTMRGSNREKLEWAFDIYDVDGNG